MPTYMIAGKKVVAEKPLSDAEIDEIAESITGTPVEAEATAPVTDDSGVEEQKNFYLNSLQQGLGDFVSGLIPDAFKYDYEAFKDVPIENHGELARQQEAQFRQRVGEFFGAETLTPESPLQSFAGSTIRNVASEGPLAVIPAKTIAQVPLALGANLVSSGAGILGGEGAAMTAEALGAEEGGAVSQTARIAGSAIGGLVPVPAGVVRDVTTRTGRNVLDARKESKQIGEATTRVFDDAADKLVTSEIQQIVKKAAEADGLSLQDSIKATQAISDSMKGLEIAPFVTLIDNPIYRKNIEYLFTSNPDFRAAAGKVIKANKDVIDARLEQRYGSVGAAEKELSGIVPKNYNSTIKAAEKRIKGIESQLAKVAERVSTKVDTVDVGQRVDALIEAKKSAVREKLSPEYERILNTAEKRRIKLKPDSVEGVYNYVENTGNRERFASMPTLYNKVRKFWAPKIDPASPKARPRSNAVSAREVDSLKREINLQLRKVKDPQKIDLLNELKSQLKSAIDTMAPTFSEAYKAIDSQYYQELGIPLNTEGVKQLSSTRFADQAGRVLIKAEQARDFLTMTGEAGLPVVRDAVMLELNNKVIKDGQVDLKALNKFLNQNKRTIDLVPNLRSEINNIGDTVRDLGATKARIEADYARRSKEVADGFYRAFNSKGLKGVAADFLNSPKKRQDILDQLKNFTPETSAMAKKGLQAALVDKALTTNGVSAVDYIKNNKNAYESLFGSSYIKDLENSALAFDMIKNADLQSMSMAKNYRNEDALSERAGISFPQLQSILRDRISNAGTKAAIISSKVFSNKSATKRDSQLAEFMLNPEAVNVVSKQVEILTDTKGLTKPARDAAVSTMANAINSSMYGIYFGVEGALNEQQRQEEEMMGQITP